MKLFPLRLIPDNTNINFIKSAKYNYTISFLIIIISCVSLFSNGLNFGIDFAGGIIIEAANPKSEFTVDNIRTNLHNKINSDFSIYSQAPLSIEYKDEIVIKLGQSNNHTSQSDIVEIIKQEILQDYPEAKFLKVDYVGPQVGSELISNGIKATILSFVGIMIYLWFRFEWQYSIGAILALIHDAIATIGFFAISGIEFNLTSIAAILTIIGYSVNDSVVIYDRIRENLRKYSQKTTKEIINLSINETLSRTILTVTTTLLANLALIIYGSSVIESFSLSMFFGIIIGTYSSIFISAPVLVKFGVKSIKGA